jgi:Zn-dependent protease
VSFIFSSTGASLPLIGWGKPTPVNPLRWRNKDLANVMVSLAGIIANIIIASIAFLILKVILMNGGPRVIPDSVREPIWIFLHYLMYMNVSLAVFNLLPFPPLDGSKVLETFLPASAQPVLEILEQHGYIIMMILIYVGFTSAIIRPIIGIVEYLLYLGTPFR